MSWSWNILAFNVRITIDWKSLLILFIVRIHKSLICRSFWLLYSHSQRNLCFYLLLESCSCFLFLFLFHPSTFTWGGCRFHLNIQESGQSFQKKIKIIEPFSNYHVIVFSEKRKRTNTHYLIRGKRSIYLIWYIG